MSKASYAALGSVWSNSITTRLRLEKTLAEVSIEYDANELQTPRKRAKTIADRNNDNNTNNDNNENNDDNNNDNSRQQLEPMMRKSITNVRQMTVVLATNLAPKS